MTNAYSRLDLEDSGQKVVRIGVEDMPKPGTAETKGGDSVSWGSKLLEQENSHDNYQHYFFLDLWKRPSLLNSGISAALISPVGTDRFPNLFWKADTTMPMACGGVEIPSNALASLSSS